MIRSQWHAPEELGEGVTQLAAHGIADGKSLSQFWRAGDVGSIRSTAGLPISMAEFDSRRTVTKPSRVTQGRVVFQCVSQQDFSKRYGSIFMKFGKGVRLGTGDNRSQLYSTLMWRFDLFFPVSREASSTL